MINSYEKEVIVAYFQGGNAAGLTSPEVLRDLLDVIKEATKDSRSEMPKGGVSYPNR